jgi:glycerol-3-phosphate acyltransferase PlsY
MLELLQQPYWYGILLFAYFVGAVPFAYLITKLTLKKDIRQMGSKNAGSTNVTRVAGKTAGIITFLLDFFKAIFVLVLVNFLVEENTTLWLSVSSLLVLLGHTKSIFLKFRGGKGVACNFALWIYLSFFSCLLMFLVWFACYRWKKIVSIASILGCITLPLGVWYFNTEYLFLALASSGYIILLHTPNIIRLIKKEENFFSS